MLEKKLSAAVEKLEEWRKLPSDSDLPGYKESLAFWKGLERLHREGCECTKCVMKGV